MITDWLLRIGDAKHFDSSSDKNIWGIVTSDPSNKYFISEAIPGDRLWFVKSQNRGLLYSVATFTHFKKRETGPLLAFTFTNEELGWTETSGNWDMEVHYTDHYNLADCEMYSEIKSPKVVRKYNEKCKVNLCEVYPNIVKYSNAKRN